MLNELQKKWVAALRSGKYKQTTNHLGGRDGYCCLGVACEVAIQNGHDIKKETNSPFTCDYVYDGSSTVLGPKAFKLFGLSNRVGKFGTKEDKADLTTINDEGWTFEKIANLIESEPEGLFDANSDSETVD